MNRLVTKVNLETSAVEKLVNYWSRTASSRKQSQYNKVQKKLP